ncbi:DNA-directed RNA polymerase, mitochondrial [Microplitis mediator]|uniref:DNA-directed RNA polymerase, mitochondrial n=1 Tax=Microplitis mediator TaxID=375433 RepID=UPI002556EB54|nr:DNA-directed RNA polymerase, mitochondrial [Microplitis mediator]
MYRLFKVPKVIIRNVCNSSQAYYDSTNHLCSHCKLEHSIQLKRIGIIQIRVYSTINTVVVPSISVKVKRKTKKYAELLEVTDCSVNSRKPAIRKINESYLSLLVDKVDKKKVNPFDYHEAKEIQVLLSEESNINVNNNNESHALDEQLHEHESDGQEELTGIMEDLHSSGIADSASIIKNMSTLGTIAEEHLEGEFEDEVGHDGKLQWKRSTNSQIRKLQLEELKAKELEKLSLAKIKNQHEGLVRALKAYLNVCINCNMIGRAYHTVIYYRKSKSHSKYSNIRDLTLYNILLQAYASRGQYSKLREIVTIIKEDKLETDAKTYAAIFECFGNISPSPKQLQFLRETYDEMNRKKITLDEVLNQSKFKVNQYNNVLRGILLINNQFKPEQRTEDGSYDCHLLNKISPTTVVQNSPAENLLNLNDLMSRFEKQIKYEMDGHVKIKSIAKFNDSKPMVWYYKNEVKKLEVEWEKAVSNAFDRDLEALRHRERTPIPNRIVLYPYLCVLEKEEYVNAILHEVRKLANGSETFSPSFGVLCRRIGKYINDKYEILEKKKNKYTDVMEKVYLKYSDWYLHRNNRLNSRASWQNITNKISHNFSLELVSAQWPNNLQFMIGKFLYNIILNDVKLDINSAKPDRTSVDIRPAFYAVVRSNNRKHLIKEIKTHPTLAKIYRESQPETLNFDTCLVPSECPPRPWSSVQSGGYLLLKTDVIRVPMFAIEQVKRLEATPTKQMWPALDCLNQLGSIPWSVNKSVLDLAIKIFRDGGSVQLNVPQPPSVLDPGPLLHENCTEAERRAFKKTQIELKRKKSEMYSLWCDALYRLSLANHYRDKIFWLPHNMDFRGRVYPVPPHLNHLGSDLARSILIFALGKPLGPNGLDWLKIHTINLTGFKKRESVTERLRYANEILDKIIDSAEKPLDGEMWWATSDEPWQTLASCMEIASALKTPNSEKYVCRFPIHQDGSCNGLQHYAALGRDQIGAESVNLYPFEKPQDVYSSVATMVDSIRSRDAANGNQIAKVLEGFVKRKIIKQTVMTTVYGVTKFGARLQIARQLKDLDDFPQEYVWQGSLYLAQKTFESLRTMFESARQIQDWFTDCAQVISAIKGKNMEWVTPLGLPVIQPYSKVLPSRSKFKDIAIDLFLKPNTIKQKNAFAPNFVHSLDSCHMMLTSLHCEHIGMTFVSVHDCYWTHPCSVEVMSKICREQFVALHSEPILEDLSKFFVEKFTCDTPISETDNLEEILSKKKLIRILSNVPKKGSFELKKVLESTYFFS